MLQTYSYIESSEISETNTTMTALSPPSLKNIRESQLFKNYNLPYKQAYFSLQKKCVRKTTIPGYKPHGSRSKRQPNQFRPYDRYWLPNPTLDGRGGGEKGEEEGGGGEGGGG
jgi:hypothetical protein